MLPRFLKFFFTYQSMIQTVRELICTVSLQVYMCNTIFVISTDNSIIVYRIMLYSDMIELDVGECSFYAVMILFGAVRTCHHIDYNTSSSCLLKTLSLTWPYWPCVSTQLLPSVRLDGGLPGLLTAPPFTTRTGHVKVHYSPLPIVTPIISRLTGFHSDNSNM